MYWEQLPGASVANRRTFMPNFGNLAFLEVVGIKIFGLAYFGIFFNNQCL